MFIQYANNDWLGNETGMDAESGFQVKRLDMLSEHDSDKGLPKLFRTSGLNSDHGLMISNIGLGQRRREMLKYICGSPM